MCILDFTRNLENMAWRMSCHVMTHMGTNAAEDQKGLLIHKVYVTEASIDLITPISVLSEQCKP